MVRNVLVILITMNISEQEMPSTRAQNRQAAEPEPVVEGAEPEPVVGGAVPPKQTRQRNSARARSKGAQGGGVAHHRRSRSVPNQEAIVEEDRYLDDEEPDIGKTLHTKDGKLGFITNKGFMAATNFIVDVASQVHSEKYSIKGYQVIVKKAGAEVWIDFFIPEAEIYNPASFKSWLDMAHLRIRWKLQCNPKSWREMIEKRLDNFEDTRFKEKFLVEKVGVQTQTCTKDPSNLNIRRAVVGPDLYFKGDGTRDPDPIHYWGNGSLSSKLGTPKLLKALDIVPDNTMDLTATIEAYMPDNFWQHQGTGGLIMSCSNADVVRRKAKQHPCPVLLGPMGIGKSSCQDVWMWNLCGSKEVSKIDPDTRNTTVKRLAAMKTFPTTIEDNSSANKEENLAIACFDQATYHVKGEEVFIETPFLITTNLASRSERAGDREDLILFEIPTASPEDMSAAEKKYEKAMHSKVIPIGATIRYGSFVLTSEFDELLERFTKMEVQINACKKRTARGYALKDVAVFYLMKTNPEVFDRLERSWDGDDNSYCHYLRTKQRDAIRTYQMELTRAGPICLRYIESAFSLAEKWDITQRLRSFAVVSSKKHRDFLKCKFVLAVKIDTPMLKNCGGVTMDLVQKVIGAIGGVENTPCASFLSQLEVYDDQVGLISKTNTQQHRAILFPISNFFSSSLIMKIAAALDNPQLCQLADEETPTSTSGNLGTSTRVVVDFDEEEDYNNISMLLEDCPINSTTVENNPAVNSHQDLELSRIFAPPQPAAQPSQPPPSSPSAATQSSSDSVDMGQTVSGRNGLFSCHCGKECTSKYGLTKHMEVCTRSAPLSSSQGNLVYTCEVCKRTFGERRYLLQHAGSQICSRRKQVLDRTASFTLALTDTPGTVLRVPDTSENGQVTCSFCKKVCKNLNGLSRHLNHCNARKSISNDPTDASLLDPIHDTNPAQPPILVPNTIVPSATIPSETLGQGAIPRTINMSLTCCNNTEGAAEFPHTTASSSTAPHVPSQIVPGMPEQELEPDQTVCPHCNKVLKKRGLGSHLKHCKAKSSAEHSTASHSGSYASQNTTVVDTNQAPGYSSDASQNIPHSSATQGATTLDTNHASAPHSSSLQEATLVEIHRELEPDQTVCPHCNRVLKKKGLGSHLKSCKLKASSERRLSVSMPLPPSSQSTELNIPKQCSKCQQTLKTVQALRTHEKFCHGPPQKLAPSRRLSTTLPVQNNNTCHICGDTLPTPTGLKVHMLSHK